MDVDFSIDIINQDNNNPNPITLPKNIMTIGKILDNDLKLYIHKNAYQGIIDYSGSDISKELGSILIGDYLQKDGIPYVVITNFIEAKYTSASASTLTFTHETWNYIHAEHEQNFPNQRIVGWQHTHPDYGIFLSSYDLFIQENFFNLGFQVAYVIDPVRKTNGFYQNKNGKAEKLSGYYVYEE